MLVPGAGAYLSGIHREIHMLALFLVRKHGRPQMEHACVITFDTCATNV